MAGLTDFIRTSATMSLGWHVIAKQTREWTSRRRLSCIRPESLRSTSTCQLPVRTPVVSALVRRRFASLAMMREFRGRRKRLKGLYQ
jgi:hypothetical protein